MSDTPRTDAKERETQKLPSATHAHYGWKHARELERELARALRVVEAARVWADDGISQYASHNALLNAIEEWEAGR